MLYIVCSLKYLKVEIPLEGISCGQILSLHGYHMQYRITD